MYNLASPASSDPIFDVSVYRHERIRADACADMTPAKHQHLKAHGTLNRYREQIAIRDLTSNDFKNSVSSRTLNTAILTIPSDVAGDGQTALVGD
ncbi:MAG: hypothetical protein ACYSWP_15345 [Planctomycetota bacterium]